jgi:hypothetical protein
MQLYQFEVLISLLVCRTGVANLNSEEQHVSQFGLHPAWLNEQRHCAIFNSQK